MYVPISKMIKCLEISRRKKKIRCYKNISSYFFYVFGYLKLSSMMLIKMVALISLYACVFLFYSYYILHTCFYVFILILFIINFIYKADVVGNRLSASSRYRGSRESLQSGMTYSARKNSNASMYNGINFTLFYV